MAVDNKFRLMTAVEAEDELGKKYFYRQKTYRYHEAGRLHAFAYHGKQCFVPTRLMKPYLEDLQIKLDERFPALKYRQVYYDDVTRRMIVDGIFGRFVAVQTDIENEEDLLKKIAALQEWFLAEGGIPESVEESNEPEVAPVAQSKAADADMPATPSALPAFPDSISFVQVDTQVIEGVTVKSRVLISLPSIAKYVGVETDYVSEWVNSSTFIDHVLSLHHKQIHNPDISGLWKKGIQKPLTPFLPLELVPEFIVAFRQSGRTPSFPGRAEQLYQLAKNTLEAVGIAIAGDTKQAAKELAKVSESLGITAADQVIEIFKRYESRPFQVQTTKAFIGKVMSEKKDIKSVTGEITLGVTDRYPAQWLMDGKRRNLPSKLRTSGREAMRAISPADSVGVTFSENHYVKDSSNMKEVIETGRQGKIFYQRLKDVGLLDV